LGTIVPAFAVRLIGLRDATDSPVDRIHRANNDFAGKLHHRAAKVAVPGSALR
jgi:hypothetical protein